LSRLCIGDYSGTIPTISFPVIDLQTSTNWKMNFSEIFDGSTAVYTILNPLSTETFGGLKQP
jgi:hypothetical protein